MRPVCAIQFIAPVILKPQAYDRWLDPGNQNSDKLQDILDNQHVRRLDHFPVSKGVNRVQNNSPELILPLPDEVY